MNNKITFPELVDLVAKNASTSKRMSELFLKELFATISQTLTDGESVTVKGIGTFKLTTVSARKSVDVNSGEEIEIPGHNKLSFAPDKDLAAAINQPFAHFETEILDDNVTDEELAEIDKAPLDPALSLNMQEGGFDDNTEPTDEEPTTPAPEEPEEEPATEEEEPEEEPATEEEEPATEEPAEAPAPIAAAVPVAEEASPIEAEPAEAVPFVAAPAPEPEQAPATEEETNETNDNNDDNMKEDRQKISHHSWLEGFVLGVISTLIVTIVTYRLFLMHPSSNSQPAATELAATAPDTAKVAPAPVAKEAPAKPEVKEEKPDTAAKLPAPAKEAQPAKEEAAPAAPEHKGGGTDVIQKGTNLFKLASKHYGNSVFWVYIYEENKSRFPNPNTIPVGTVLNIPAASKYGIDKNNAQSVANAKQKQGKIFGAISKKK